MLLLTVNAIISAAQRTRVTKAAHRTRGMKSQIALNAATLPMPQLFAHNPHPTT